MRVPPRHCDRKKVARVFFALPPPRQRRPRTSVSSTLARKYPYPRQSTRVMCRQTRIEYALRSVYSRPAQKWPTCLPPPPPFFIPSSRLRSVYLFPRVVSSSAESDFSGRKTEASYVYSLDADLFICNACTGRLGAAAIRNGSLVCAAEIYVAADAGALTRIDAAIGRSRARFSPCSNYSN